MWRSQNSVCVRQPWLHLRVLSALLLTVGSVICGGCQPSLPNSNPIATSGVSSVTTAGVPTTGAGSNSGSAESTGTSSSGTGVATPQRAKRPTFNEQAAFEILQKQCSYGPRPLGSTAHEQAKDYLLAQMKQYADDTFTQTFRYHGMTVTNIVGIFYPAGSSAPARKPVLVLTHWDSRPVADGPFSTKKVAYKYGPRGWNQTNPIMAANDGASGPGIMLQLAKMFKQQKPNVGVVMLLDDGEDYGDFQANGGAGDGVELGSRYFAEHFREDKRLGFPDYGILLDMVGGKDLVLPFEKVSLKYAPGTLTKVFAAGQSLGYRSVFRDDLQFEVEDDHLALNRAGMMVIDLIPFFGNSAPAGVPGYIYWHTPEDTVDKCSPNALKVVGETVAEVIYNETPAP